MLRQGRAAGHRVLDYVPNMPRPLGAFRQCASLTAIDKPGRPLRLRLYDITAHPTAELVGVLALGIPTQVAVLTSVFRELTPSAHHSH